MSRTWSARGPDVIRRDDRDRRRQLQRELHVEGPTVAVEVMGLARQRLRADVATDDPHVVGCATADRPEVFVTKKWIGPGVPVPPKDVGLLVRSARYA